MVLRRRDGANRDSDIRFGFFTLISELRSKGNAMGDPSIRAIFYFGVLFVVFGGGLIWFALSEHFSR